MELSAIRLFVRELEAAGHFYGSVLGLARVAGDARSGWLVFDLGGPQLVVEAVAEDAPPEEQALVGRFTGLSLAVDDIECCYEQLRARGVSFDGAPERQAWGGMLATLRDPAGNQLQLVQTPNA
jgi:catechol 2,3-dioxygenase-like lactoylglutathione lyase family enzyme